MSTLYQFFEINEMPLGLLCVEMIQYCKSYTKKDQQERKCSFRDQVQEFDREQGFPLGKGQTYHIASRMTRLPINGVHGEVIYDGFAVNTQSVPDASKIEWRKCTAKPRAG